MAKAKRGKSGSSTEMSRWEHELAQAPLNEAIWNSMSVLVSPGNLDDVDKINCMNDIVVTGLRKLISVVDCHSLLNEVKELTSHAKGGKGKTVSKPPQFFEICDQAKLMLDQGEQLSPAMLAKIIKFKLLALKQKDIDRRAEEKKAAEAAAKLAKQGDERNRSRLASGKRGKSQSPNKKKGKKDDCPPSPKKDTKLKRRGEVEDTFKTMDDEPEGPEDPQHYFLITGFYDPKIYACLTEIGIFPDANLVLKSECKEVEVQQDDDHFDQEMAPPEGDQEGESAEDDESARRELEEKISALSSNTDLFITRLPNGHPLKNMANIEILLTGELGNKMQQPSMEKIDQADFGTKLFDLVANQCFRLLNEKMHYKRYLELMALVEIPSVHKSAELGSHFSTEEVDLRMYNQLMNSVPAEKHTASLVLHCLLEQVSWSMADDHADSEHVKEKPEFSLEEYIDQKLQQFDFKGKENDHAVDGLSPKSPPVILHFEDKLTEKFFDADQVTGGVDPLSTERAMLKFSPFCQFFSALSQPCSNQIEISCRQQQLGSLWDQKNGPRSTNQLWSGLLHLLFEAIPLQCVDEYGDVSEPNLENNLAIATLDHPFYVAGLHDLNSTAEIKDYMEQRNLSQFSYLEPHQPGSIVQVLMEAVETRPFIDTYLHKATGSLLVVLHNPVGDDCQSKVGWDTWVHSDVGFRNYMEFIRDYVDDWQREEDRVNEKRQASVAIPKETEASPTPTPLKPENRNQMLTRQEIAEMKAAEEDKSKKKGKRSARKSGKSDGGGNLKAKNKGSEARGPSGKASKTSNLSARSKTLSGKAQQLESMEKIEGKESDQVQEKKYHFRGYDIGDNIIHVSGFEWFAFPDDDALVKINICEFVHGNKSVRTYLYKNGITFIIHCRNPRNEQAAEGDAATEEKNSELTTPIPDIQVPPDESSKDLLENETLSHHSGSYNPLLVELPQLPPVREPESEFSCLTFRYNDGLVCSMSAAVSDVLYNNYKTVAEKLSLAEKGTTEGQNPLGSSQGIQSNTQVKAGSPKGRKKQEEDKKQEELERIKEQERRHLLGIKHEIEEFQAALYRLQEFNLSCPDGLHVTFAVSGDTTASPQSRRVIVRQSYPEIRGNKHRCEKDRIAVALKESVRCITQEGHVIKILKDGTSEVFFPNGSILRASPLKERSDVTEGKAGNDTMEEGAAHPPTKGPSRTTPLVPKETSFEHQSCKGGRAKSIFVWEVVDPEGEKLILNAEGEVQERISLLTSVATCPKSQETMMTREDGVSVITRSDGTRIIEHVDCTRITVQELKEGMMSLETGEPGVSNNAKGNLRVKVECTGYATVVSHGGTGVLEVLFGEGTSVKAFKKGGYALQRTDSGQVLIDRAGNCLYTEDKKVHFDGTPILSEEILPKTSYLLRLSSPKTLSTIDAVGNSFICYSNGTIEFEKGSSELEIDEEQRPVESLHPRFFILHADGSGEELLCKAQVENYLKEMEKDCNSAILSSDISNFPNAKGITVIKPFKGSVSQRWLKTKDEENIIPIELTERDFHAFPSKKDRINFISKAAGPEARKESPLPTKTQKHVTACPPVLELRHLILQPELTKELKEDILDTLGVYRDILRRRMELEEGMQPTEPRSEDEIASTRALVAKVYETLSNPEEDGFMHQHENAAKASYLQAIAPSPSPPPVKAEPQRSAAEWEKDRIEVAETKYAKECLKHGIVPPYFDTEQGQAFLKQQRKLNTEMTALSSNLAKKSLHPTHLQSNEHLEGQGSPLSQYDRRISSQDLPLLFNDSTNSMNNNSSSSFSQISDQLSVDRRPINPTPIAGQAVVTTCNMPLFVQASAPVETQVESGKEKPLLKEDSSGIISDDKKHRKVDLPRSILGSRPGCLRNDKFMEIEDPVRRTMKTASLAGSVNPQSTAQMRGFILVPDFVDFGVLKEGCSYVHTVEMKNVGVDICRYKIRQPPPSTGLQVNYKPGPVAAGMSAAFELELFAIAVGVEGQNGVGSIAHHVEIITETDALYLPVVATILTAYDYDCPSEDSQKVGPSKGTVQLKQRPLSRESLTRPRKQENV